MLIKIYHQRKLICDISEVVDNLKIKAFLMPLDIEKAFYLVNDLFLITILGNYDFKKV